MLVTLYPCLMPRPTRIQYDHAFYHVMNRGRGRQAIFHDEAYYSAFLETLSEAHARFDAVIHAYCLMGNHYHLLIETPRANLDRIMHHINGVYTQRYNRLRETDGPLFRGRYKAILVDADAYLLQLSRYIHRNPVEVRGADIDKLNRYKWSSYLAYINKTKAAPWLEQEKTYQMLGQRRRYAGYKAFVAHGVDDEINNFYGKGNVSAVLGGDEFKQELVKREADLQVSGDLCEAVMERPSVAVVVQAICMVFDVLPQSLLQRQPGR